MSQEHYLSAEMFSSDLLMGMEANIHLVSNEQAYFGNESKFCVNQGEFLRKHLPSKWIDIDLNQYF